MPTIELQVTNPSGIHARPATHFVKIASGFASRITLENLDRASRPVDAKSLLMLLTAGVVAGHRVRITAEGPDADAALDALRAGIEGGLGESASG